MTNAKSEAALASPRTHEQLVAQHQTKQNAWNAAEAAALAAEYAAQERLSDLDREADRLAADRAKDGVEDWEVGLFF
jgi:hypothetical protein